MGPIRLARSPQRADLRGFVVATAALWIGLAIVVTVITGSYWALSVGLLTAGGYLALGLWRPGTCHWLYRVFNRLASTVGRLTAIAVRFVCFHLVLRSVGLMGSRLQRARPARMISGWQPRGGLEVTLLKGSKTRGRRHGWVRDYASWASSGSNCWVWCLLPFLVVLSTVELDDENGVSAGNYTLY
jgi:hypothetical protein